MKIFKVAKEAGSYLDNMLDLKNADVTTVKLTGEQGSASIELLEFKSPHPRKDVDRKMYDVGPTHVAFTVENVETLHETLLNAGIYCTAVPQLSPDGKAKVTFCRDPDGTAIELVQVLDV